MSSFISKSLASGFQKVVIDLQQNTGGQVLLAFDIFRRFFPNIDPFVGSRMRAYYAADVMGSVVISYYDSLSSD